MSHGPRRMSHAPRPHQVDDSVDDAAPDGNRLGLGIAVSLPSSSGIDNQASSILRSQPGYVEVESDA